MRFALQRLRKIYPSSTVFFLNSIDYAINKTKKGAASDVFYVIACSTFFDLFEFSKSLKESTKNLFHQDLIRGFGHYQYLHNDLNH